MTPYRKPSRDHIGNGRFRRDVDKRILQTNQPAWQHRERRIERLARKYTYLFGSAA